MCSTPTLSGFQNSNMPFVKNEFSRTFFTMTLFTELSHINDQTACWLKSIKISYFIFLGTYVQVKRKRNNLQHIWLDLILR